VEVLSAGSARHDRITKRRFFQSHGVPEYWVVDGESEAIEVWRPTLDVPALEIDVSAFFAGVAYPP
jgi:Uma2 family endonuclease